MAQQAPGGARVARQPHLWRGLTRRSAVCRVGRRATAIGDADVRPALPRRDGFQISMASTEVVSDEVACSHGRFDSTFSGDQCS